MSELIPDIDKALELGKQVETNTTNIATNTSSIATLSSGKVNLSGDTMTGDLNTKGINFYKPNITKGTVGTAGSNSILFCDNTVSSSASHRMGAVQNNISATGDNLVSMSAYNFLNTTSNDGATISVGVTSSGVAYTYAPTPATTDNSTKIATTAWARGVQKFSNVVGISLTWSTSGASASSTRTKATFTLPCKAIIVLRTSPTANTDIGSFRYIGGTNTIPMYAGGYGYAVYTDLMTVSNAGTVVFERGQNNTFLGAYYYPLYV